MPAVTIIEGEISNGDAGKTEGAGRGSRIAQLSAPEQQNRRTFPPLRRPRRGNICWRTEVLICAASQHGRRLLLQKRNGPELETLGSAIWFPLRGRREEAPPTRVNGDCQT